MTFYMPTRVIEGQDCVLAHAGDLSRFGNMALIVTGKSSAVKCGALADVQNALKVPSLVFDQVEENPSVETVVKAAELGLVHGADFVIGIGGGSPLDAAKAIGFLMNRGNPDASALYDASLPPISLPLVAIPTTCGTGSEVTGVSVLTRHDLRTKKSIPHKIFPDLALVDGKYLKAAPRSLLASTAVDALCHMVESLLSKSSGDYSQAMALYGLSVFREGRQVLTGKREASSLDYARLMRASTFAGMAIAQTGTSIPHALSYILTYEERIPHGIACGTFLGAFLGEAATAECAGILGAAGFRGLGDLEDFLREVMPQVKVSQAVKERAIESVLAQPARMQGCRVPMDEAVLRRMVKASLPD